MRVVIGLQLVQEGNSFRSLQPLTPDQLQHIASVLKQNRQAILSGSNASPASGPDPSNNQLDTYLVRLSIAFFSTILNFDHVWASSMQLPLAIAFSLLSLAIRSRDLDLGTGLISLFTSTLVGQAARQGRPRRAAAPTPTARGGASTTTPRPTRASSTAS